MQRQHDPVYNGRGYSTELAGRDRFKFFRRPVEPDPAVMDAASIPTQQLAMSYPSMSMPSNATAFTASLPVKRGGHSTGAAAAAGADSVPQYYRPSSSASSGTRWRPYSGSNISRGAGGQSLRGKKKGKPHYLPRLPQHQQTKSGEETSMSSTATPGATMGTTKNAAVQTMYRDNEAQTDPFSPNYYIPEGAPTPEVLGLQSLTWQNGGLPAGKEEVELIQRLRRRRALEATLPTGSDATSVEVRYRALHELEEQECAERDEHAEKLQQRRLDRLREALMDREAAREEANRERLQRIKEQYMNDLGSKLYTLEKRRLAMSKRGVDRMAEVQGRKPTSNSVVTMSTPPATCIRTYTQYGCDAAPPKIGLDHNADSQLRAARQTFNYDVRPQLLSSAEGAEVVDNHHGQRMGRVPEKTFAVPHNEAVARLPTLYQRREADRVLSALEYAYKKMHHGEGDGEETAESRTQHVLSLYRATPKLQRPETPVLELDGDDEEEVDDACVLLQRLLRGRAVQNDFFEGRERCRGLIEELQAASQAGNLDRGAAEAKELEELQRQRDVQTTHILDSALGEIVHETVDFLYQELTRQQDVAKLRALQAEAEEVRRSREAAERERRAELRQQRDRDEVAYAAYIRATDTVVRCFLDDIFAGSVDETATSVAVRSELERKAACPSPRQAKDDADAENIVCDMMDRFLLPAIVDRIALQERERMKQARAAAALDAAHSMPFEEEEEEAKEN